MTFRDMQRTYGRKYVGVAELLGLSTCNARVTVSICEEQIKSLSQCVRACVCVSVFVCLSVCPLITESVCVG